MTLHRFVSISVGCTFLLVAAVWLFQRTSETSEPFEHLARKTSGAQSVGDSLTSSARPDEVPAENESSAVATSSINLEAAVQPQSSAVVSASPDSASNAGRTFGGLGESSLLGPHNSVDSRAVEALLAADNFSSFASQLARSSSNVTDALQNEQDYRLGLDSALGSLPDARVTTIGCGTNLCVVELSAAADASVLRQSAIRAFGQSGLPSNALMPLIVSSPDARARVRLVVGFGTGRGGIYVPPGA